MGLFSRLFGGRKGRKGEVHRKEALGRVRTSFSTTQG